MTADREKQVLRLPKRHSGRTGDPPDPELGARLLRAQSPRAAVTASLIVIIVFSIAWAMLVRATGQVWPWMTVVQAVLLGFAIRHAGRGVDWRFPTIAAVMAIGGALVANIVVSASNTAGELGTGTLTVLRSVTSMTWPVFFTEVFTPADVVYAVSGAGLAAFFANRRLTRREFGSVRLSRQEEQRDSNERAR